MFTGDQIVGATIYFENMSSEETAELLKNLNKHKVGLKLQHKTGDKSPCRSPMGTLSWEGRSGFGDSSPDIILVSVYFVTFDFQKVLLYYIIGYNNIINLVTSCMVLVGRAITDS